ncbi:hypothetical protein [Methanobrevibacter sp. DSM 116169]|uniref:hypothetical protein n=1 Tax=Methanobrevibacter sp. DSM 116169 TaxID=3242727 RepID=UPI0038FC415A
MITITKKEELVLNQIKIFNFEFDDGIPENILKEELGIYEHELNEILNVLKEKELISYEMNRVKLSDNEAIINAVDSQLDVKNAELDKKEKDSLEIIQGIVNEDNTVPRYILEGNLLYGDLKLTNFRMYHIILSLENKGLLKKISKNDGEYYLLL